MRTATASVSASSARARRPLGVAGVRQPRFGIACSDEKLLALTDCDSHGLGRQRGLDFPPLRQCDLFREISKTRLRGGTPVRGFGKHRVFGSRESRFRLAPSLIELVGAGGAVAFVLCAAFRRRFGFGFEVRLGRHDGVKLGGLRCADDLDESILGCFRRGESAFGRKSRGLGVRPRFTLLFGTDGGGGGDFSFVEARSFLLPLGFRPLELDVAPLGLLGFGLVLRTRRFGGCEALLVQPPAERVLFVVDPLDVCRSLTGGGPYSLGSCARGFCNTKRVQQFLLLARDLLFGSLDRCARLVRDDFVGRFHFVGALLHCLVGSDGLGRRGSLVFRAAATPPQMPPAVGVRRFGVAGRRLPGARSLHPCALARLSIPRCTIVVNF